MLTTRRSRLNAGNRKLAVVGNTGALGTLLALCLFAQAGTAQSVDLAQINWTHGAADCEADLANPDRMEWQQVRYRPDTVIFRQNKCSNFEAPFVYLFIGTERALVIDTGATPEGGPSLLDAIRQVTALPLIAAHSHGHGDHTQGDATFVDAANVQVVGTGAEAVQAYFGFTNWPREPVQLELGGRTLELLPIPGHSDDDLAYYDPAAQLLITGDTLYPGRLYVRNWSDYRSSIARLNAWLQDRPVAHVLGTHIEMTATPDVDYPMGTTYQPDEIQLPLAQSDVVRLHQALLPLASPERTYLGSFIIWPVD